jgi:hypothetical protein
MGMGYSGEDSRCDSLLLAVLSKKRHNPMKKDIG